ncbi:hypothetical protein [Cuniculiplasma divulgatum]|jgi:hypothetical protein|uniref:Uncharacterized protein n=1 Tax=Cuniculiplasma divulgatum TaxID=1673428 RepID=A0A1R4A8V8_9ARCH|nr:hypothetical protein [Cuniculiplasma divulgatum]MCI2412720.1 hypothetical protein [Cuniculiplasma sp.]SJK85390.1 hypothetical protein CPM_1603 [Cuniculiplasma divulgatum]
MKLYHIGLYKLYGEIDGFGDPLTGLSVRIDLERIRPILTASYNPFPYLNLM